MNVEARSLFDLPEGVVYLNCAGNSPQLKASTCALVQGAQDKAHPWNRKPEHFFNLAEQIRTVASGAFGGVADNYCVIPAASYGISTAARIIESEITPGQKIVLMEEEFPSNVLPWRRVSKESGAEIVTVARPDDHNWTKAFIEAIDKKTKVVALSACHWTDGTIVDLMQIKQKCLEVGAALVVDATQMLGAHPIDIENLDPDFLVASGYKWLLSPYGFSLMYVSERQWDKRPLEETWLARENAEDFSGLVKYNDNYLPGSRRYDVGEKNTITVLPGAVEALEQIKHWGVEKISAQLQMINQKISERLEEYGFILPPEKFRSPHMFGALTTEKHHPDLVARLSHENIFVSQRGKSIRFSPHLYIDQNNLEKLFQSLPGMVK